MDVRFGSDMVLTLRFIKVVEHGEPVLILGSDILRGGRPLAAWNFSGFKVLTKEVGKVEGSICFTKAGKETECPLLNAPAGLSERKTGVRLHPEPSTYACAIPPDEIPQMIARVCSACARTGDSNMARKAC